MKHSSAADRQRGRALHLRQLDEAAAREKAEQRHRLQRRVERRALQHKVLVQATELEKELEARRCKLCDLLRAEAWGLGHPNWTERKCSGCWAHHADALAWQRHSLARGAGAADAASRSPPTRPRSATAAAAATAAPAGERRGPGPSADGNMGSAAAAAAAGGPGRGGSSRELLSPSRLFGGVAPDRLDAVIEALRARDGDRLMQLLEESALARHFGRHAGQGQGEVSQLRQRPPQPHMAPPPEEPYGSYYYHDVVLGELGAGMPVAEGAGAPAGDRPADPEPETEPKPESESESESEEGSAKGEQASSSLVANAGGGSRPPRSRRREGRHAAARSGQGGSETSDDDDDGDDDDEDGVVVGPGPSSAPRDRRDSSLTAATDNPGLDPGKYSAYGGAAAGAAAAGDGHWRQQQQQQRQPQPEQQPTERARQASAGAGAGAGPFPQHGRASDAATEFSFAAGAHAGAEEAGAAATPAVEAARWLNTAERQRHPGGPGPVPVPVPVPGRERVAGYRPEARPLPSKPRRVPADEAELEEALREAERLVVFGSTQHRRSEALFYSHQLRAALADLRLLRRRAGRAAAVHRQGMRLAPRDEEGVKRIIREGRPERSPSPATLRRLTQPESCYVDPPRRVPGWLDHVHPDRPDPARAIDPVAWRPPSAKPPPPRHTAGLQSAGDWGEYRYEWELAQIRSLPVDDYLAQLRKEREFRSAWAEVQARADVLSGGALK